MIDFKTKRAQNVLKLLAVMTLNLISSVGFAQGAASPAKDSVIANPLFIALVAVIILLLFVIFAFAETLKGAAAHKRRLEKEKQSGAGAGRNVGLILLLLSGDTLSAQSPVAFPATCYGLSLSIMSLLLSIIAFELLIIFILYRSSRRFLESEIKRKVEVKVQPTIIEKLNASVAIEREADIMLDHDYDGIRELDNDLPPWWKYGFYLTIVFSVVYLVSYHIAGTGKLQLAEYDEQMQNAAIEMAEYRKKAAGLVDENNAVLLTDADALSSGQNTYMNNCAACHGEKGEGGVGPNLTDNYWLHKGSIRDVFRTIKFGVADKGMKSWQQDLGAKQIHEVASFILSLQGTNPPNAKEKQGELFVDQSVADSVAVTVPDSVLLSGAK
jgi:cytochrome c oxidase cbb3-type subunit 3